MSKFLLFFFSFSYFIDLAQAPHKMSYQAVIRNNADALIVNQTIGMKVTILQGSVSGASIFEETHRPTTNANGLVSFAIGTGVATMGKFDTINWANGPYFIKTETDPGGGTNYNITAVSQLL